MASSIRGGPSSKITAGMVSTSQDVTKVTAEPSPDKAKMENKPESQDDSSKEVVTVEYIKENDFEPRLPQRYSPRTILKSNKNVAQGKGYKLESPHIVTRRTSRCTEHIPRQPRINQVLAEKQQDGQATEDLHELAESGQVCRSHLTRSEDVLLPEEEKSSTKPNPDDATVGTCLSSSPKTDHRSHESPGQTSPYPEHEGREKNVSSKRKCRKNTGRKPRSSKKRKCEQSVDEVTEHKKRKCDQSVDEVTEHKKHRRQSKNNVVNEVCGDEDNVNNVVAGFSRTKIDEVTNNVCSDPKITKQKHNQTNKTQELEDSLIAEMPELHKKHKRSRKSLFSTPAKGHGSANQRVVEPGISFPKDDSNPEMLAENNSFTYTSLESAVVTRPGQPKRRGSGHLKKKQGASDMGSRATPDLSSPGSGNAPENVSESSKFESPVAEYRSLHVTSMAGDNDECLLEGHGKGRGHRRVRGGGSRGRGRGSGKGRSKKLQEEDKVPFEEEANTNYEKCLPEGKNKSRTYETVAENTVDLSFTVQISKDTGVTELECSESKAVDNISNQEAGTQVKGRTRGKGKGRGRGQSRSRTKTQNNTEVSDIVSDQHLDSCASKHSQDDSTVINKNPHGRGDRPRRAARVNYQALEEGIFNSDEQKQSRSGKTSQQELNYMELGKNMTKQEDRLQDNSALNSARSQDVKKTPSNRRGQKRKLIDDDEPKTKPSEMLKCAHCKEEIPRKTIKRHMALMHNRLWSSDNPEGIYAPKEIFKICGQVICDKCDRPFKYLSFFNFHVKWCGKEDMTVKCEICEKEIRAMYARDHIRRHKLTADTTPKKDQSVTTQAKGKRKAAQRALDEFKQTVFLLDGDDNESYDKDSDDDPEFKVEGPVSGNEDENEEEEDDDEDDKKFSAEGNDDSRGSPRRKLQKVVQSTSNASSTYNINSPNIRRKPGVSAPLMVDEAYDWTFDWLKGQGEEAVFPEWLPKKANWVKLSKQDMEDYLPKSRQSPNFSIFSGKKNLLPDINLNRFEALHEDVPCFYAGGEVWAVAWMPVPVAMVTTQYVAVYCHREIDMRTYQSETSTRKALVQIWDCGALQSRSLVLPPCLSLGIAQDFSYVKEMKWCPNGAWQRSTDSTPEGFYKRMGILAMACGDGKIWIFSVPDPKHLDQIDGSLPIYHVEPTAILLASHENVETESSVCCGLDWQLTQNHCRIAAGFSDGTVSLWDLGSQSPLLRSKKTSGVDVFRPYHTFQAHFKSVTSVAYNPRTPHILSTCSYDRLVKTWNLCNTNYPMNHTSRSQFCRIISPIHFPMILSAGDDCYCLEHNGVIGFDSGYYGVCVRVMAVHNAAIWDLDFSLWLHSLASVDNAGQVMVMSLPPMAYHTHQSKTITSRRFQLINTYVQKLDPELEMNDKSIGKKKKVPTATLR